MVICENDKITIRNLEVSDKALILKWLSDDEVLKYYEGRDRKFDEKLIEKKFYNKDIKINRCIIEYLEMPIGYMQFYEINNEECEEYGCDKFNGKIFGTDQFIGETKFWGQGIGKELIKLIVHYLIFTEKAQKLVLDPQAWNKRAINCYEKSGYKKVKLLPKHELHEGEFRDCWLMEYDMKLLDLGGPNIEEAKLILEEASKLNPGPWIEHSLYVGRAAELIAKEDKDLDSNIALALGMLHDIGRRYGVTSMRHSIDGYNYAAEKGYNLLARICLTHSFSYQNVDAVFGKWDCSKEEYNFVKDYLNNLEYSPYDKLIQLCDALALPSGYCLMEKRMIDVALRHGVNQYTTEKWRAYFEVKKYFEERIGKSIYRVLPGALENTFEL